MGMFTRVVHPKNGRELQIKTGDDDLEEYHVGQDVKWRIDERYPGEGTLLDGVYESYSGLGEDDLVIIRDHKISAVVPRCAGYSEQDIEIILDIKPFERNWWPEYKWVEKELKEKQNEIKRLKEDIAFLKTCRGKTDEQIHVAKEKRMAEVLCNPIRTIINYKSLSRNLFKVKKIK